MKRVLTAELLLILLLVGCGRTTQPGDSFYYLTAQPQLGGEQTLFEAELRELNPALSWENRIQTYLTGPVNSELRNPFPQNLRVIRANLREKYHRLELTLSEEYDQLDGMALTLANACLIQTLTAYDAVEQVALYCSTGRDLMNGAAYLTADQFLPMTGVTEQEHTVRIYYADKNNRYLLPAVRKVVAEDTDSLGIFALHQLMEKPGESTMYPVMPTGTRLLGFSVQDGIATVDLSEEFFSRRPRTELGERMTIYALVNTLTELNAVSAVRILVEGQQLEYYNYLKISEPLTRWEEMIGPVRIGVNEFDATLYYRTWSEEYLAAVPTRIIRDDTKGLAEKILQTLLESNPPNGYQNLIPKNTQILMIETIEGVCHVDLSGEFLQSGSKWDQQQALAALVASLCSVDSIQAVQLTIEGQTPTIGSYDLSELLSAQSNWFFPS